MVQVRFDMNELEMVRPLFACMPRCAKTAAACLDAWGCQPPSFLIRATLVIYYIDPDRCVGLCYGLDYCLYLPFTIVYSISAQDGRPHVDLVTSLQACYTTLSSSLSPPLVNSPSRPDETNDIYDSLLSHRSKFAKYGTHPPTERQPRLTRVPAYSIVGVRFTAVACDIRNHSSLSRTTSSRFRLVGAPR
ncbi:hypothetical protein TMatcc_008293 [Talaromyces marneffei ATCC 18224]|uniref:uncharacterized protein n=1 Tax=Talaromyces marneffei TaxID=37727 RepID=UPI0012AA5346|nr:uncharacterized protein EYB26_007643 [Talaromyces marneffei]KAE8550280.1 hypothetical protein EYB25_006504 [Talaromyces marneffei]QGA19945.1 hypothetical protein EYB26_007643 [Talaromyces marneffei]